jgi:hypothetical protein
MTDQFTPILTMIEPGNRAKKGFVGLDPRSEKSGVVNYAVLLARSISRHPCAYFLPFFELILIVSAARPPAQPVFRLQAVLRCNTGIKNMKIAWRGDLHIRCVDPMRCGSPSDLLEIPVKFCGSNCLFKSPGP